MTPHHYQLSNGAILDNINFLPEEPEVFVRRPGHPTHHEEPASEHVDHYQVIEFLTPIELKNLLIGCVYQPPKVVTEDNRSVVIIPNVFGDIRIFATEQIYPWNQESPADDFTVQIEFNGVFVSGDRLNELNIRYNRFQLINFGDNLRTRTRHTLRGGRTAENLMWSIIQHFQDAERLFKDLSLFDNVSLKDS